MTSPGVALGGSALPVRPLPQRIVRLAVRALCLAFFFGNIVVIVWIWVANGNLPIHTVGDFLSRVGGLAGLLAAYLALIQVLLLARLPLIERLASFDRLNVWHRWNGFACVALVVAHTIMDVWGYGIGSHTGFFSEFWLMVGRDAFPGMVTATIAAVLFVVIAVSSLLIVRTRMPYEAWFALHLTAYAAIALAWFHEIPVGGELALNPGDATYWRVLFFGSLTLIAFRLFGPVVTTVRYRLRVAEVVAEGPDIVSLRLTGRRLDRLGARAGQFFIWRFLTPGFWWTAHPFSLSAAPDGRSLRITVKAAGDHTRRIGAIPVGTRVIVEGPFGDFTESARRSAKVLMVAGGIGITPVRALAEVIGGDIAIVHRVRFAGDIVFQDELDAISRARGIALHTVVGDHASAEGRDLLSPAHLRELVPDLAERDTYVCGPPAMVSAIVANLLRAGVSRRRLHVERFAL